MIDRCPRRSGRGIVLPPQLPARSRKADEGATHSLIVKGSQNVPVRYPREGSTRCRTRRKPCKSTEADARIRTADPFITSLRSTHHGIRSFAGNSGTRPETATLPNSAALHAPPGMCSNGVPIAGVISRDPTDRDDEPLPMRRAVRPATRAVLRSPELLDDAQSAPGTNLCDRVGAESSRERSRDIPPTFAGAPE